MGDEWILDVLTDLKAYAQKNGMAVLAEQLDDARLVAAAELATHDAQRRRATEIGVDPAARAAHRAS